MIDLVTMATLYRKVNCLAPMEESSSHILEFKRDQCRANDPAQNQALNR
jgi:hypothetical protein